MNTNITIPALLGRDGDEMSTMRISGIASGLDTEQMVRDLMKAENLKLNKIQQTKQLLTWRQERYTTFNKDFANFILDAKKDFGLTKVTSTGTMLSNSLSNLDWVKKATSSNESVASVSTTSKAVNGSYSVHVESLAENFTVASSTNITTGTSKTNIAEQLGLEATDTLDFTIETNYGPKRFIFGDTTEIQDASKIVVNKTLDQISLNDIVTSINSAKVTVDGKEVALGVKAVYDSSIDRFFLQTTATGAENWMKITDNSSLNFIAGDANKLNLNIKNYDAIDPTTTYTGKNAVIDFAGATGIIQKSNQFTINGINFDLKATGDFTVRVDNNVDGVYEKISNFVEKYNELVEKNSSLLTEKQYRSYKPLSEDEKKDMKDKDVELWEERAKSGLRNRQLWICIRDRKYSIKGQWKEFISE